MICPMCKKALGISEIIYAFEHPHHGNQMIGVREVYNCGFDRRRSFETKDDGTWKVTTWCPEVEGML